MVMPGGAAANHRWRAMAARGLGTAARNGVLPASPPSVRNALFALFIGSLLACEAAFAWHMPDRSDLVNLVRDVGWAGKFDLRADEREAGMTAGEHLANLGERRPIIRSSFDVHLVENRLIYVKERCGPEDTDAPFFVQVEPVSPDDLPDHRRPHGFDNLVFRFDRYGARFDGKCLADFPLPDYEIEAIRTGQYVEVEDGYRNEWMGEIGLRALERVAKLAAEYRTVLAGRPPYIRSDFDVYLFESRLIYVKEPCGPEDIDAPFFVHVHPVSPDDLPDHRRLHGHDTLAFLFGRYGARVGRTCLADFPLPDYDVEAIVTGQYVEVEEGYRNEWVGEIDLRALERAAKLAAEYRTILAGRPPYIRSDFDVYLFESRLIYVKEPCGPEDIDAPFFVHVHPVSPDDLPDQRRLHGHDNFTFLFGRYGARVGRTCLTDFPLPDYDIEAIVTGQYVEVEGGYRNEWVGRIDVWAIERVARLRPREYSANPGERQPIIHFGSDVNLYVRVDRTTVGEHLASLVERRPIIRSDFDVYLLDNRLIYVKEPCGPEDIDGWFFVHVEPVSPDDLPYHRKLHGHDNLIFRFDRHGARSGRTCLADFLLPDYDIAAIRTGQYVETESGYRNVWLGEHSMFQRRPEKRR